MSSQIPSFSATLFYSYCHEDERYKAAMEKSLALLRQNNLLSEWSDHRILPGESISAAIESQIEKADIYVFLLSQSFIDSGECMKEWRRAKTISKTGRLVFRIPIILEDCAWPDLLKQDDLKALPKDGQAVCTFTHESTAWNQVYDGIKSVIETLRRNFSPKEEFLREMQSTEFIAQKKIDLSQLYVFPRLSCYSQKKHATNLTEDTITRESELLKKGLVLVHGEEMSGKTALIRHIFLNMAKASKPVLYMDLSNVSGKPSETLFRNAYQNEFKGDYALWKVNKNKTLLLDNLSAKNGLVDLLEFSKGYFSTIIVTLPTDIFTSYFQDDDRVADFYEMKIRSLTHIQQERLIRDRLNLMERDTPVLDGEVDRVEDQVNSIITYNKIVPRYPFYVLSILQTYEAFMPSNLPITSFGHCYYVLIISKLIKAGVSQADSDINACFNFLEKLAYDNYRLNLDQIDRTTENFQQFRSTYEHSYFIKASTVNRLKHQDYGLIGPSGQFRANYMYFFFLGRYFAKSQLECEEEIARICKESHLSPNDLIVLFIIHHTTDNELIYSMTWQTMCSLENVEPAVLDDEESALFYDLISSFPKNILTDNSVQYERESARRVRDRMESISSKKDTSWTSNGESRSEEIFRVLKNIHILGQILRNRYGTLERKDIVDIVETISDGGLRLINCRLGSEKAMKQRIINIKKKNPDYDARELEQAIRVLSFLWTMANLAAVVHAINVPEIRSAVASVVNSKSTPAYDLIGYFNALDSDEQLTPNAVNDLETLMKRYKNPFIRAILSLRTQSYMKTHTSKAALEQKICSLLGIRYVRGIASN